MNKDYWQEKSRMKHKTPEDVLLAEIFAEMKKQSEREARRAKIKATKEHYLKNRKTDKPETLRILFLS